MNEIEESREIQRKKRREYRKKERRKKRIKKFLISVLIFISLMSVYYIIYYTDFFFLENISVKGNETVDKGDIISESGLLKGENVLFISKEKLVENINEMAYVKETRIEKKLPNGIEIFVVERMGAILFKSENEIILMDFEGIPLEITEVSVEDCMIIENDNSYEYEIGKKILFNENNISFDLIVDLMYYISLNDMDYVNKFKISGEDVYVYMDNGTLVRLDQSKDMKYQLIFSKNIIDDRTEKNKDVNGLIDYTKGENPVYISAEDAEVHFEE